MAQEQRDTAVHLAVVGGGIAGCAAAESAASNGADVTLFNAGLPLGGTSIHVGNFPARSLMAAATDHHRAERPRFPGLATTASAPDWSALREMIDARADAVCRRMRARLEKHPNIELIDRRASFSDESTLVAGDRRISPDRVLLTPGSHPHPPQIEGLDEVSFLTLENLGELEELPTRLLFVETSAAALAYTQGFARLGVKVALVSEYDHPFDGRESSEVNAAVESLLAEEGVEFFGDASITHVDSRNDGVRLFGNAGDRPRRWDTDRFVLVDHRRPRIDELNPAAAGIELDDRGFIVVDESLQTTNPDVFAAGDAIGRGDHANAAAYDALRAVRNAVSPSRTAGQHIAVPFAVYTDPQLAGVGWSEPHARQAGFPVEVATVSLQELPSTHACGHANGFVKLVRDRNSGRLVGARLLSFAASELVMELTLAVRYGLTTDDLAALVYPPISTGEAISYAARQFQ